MKPLIKAGVIAAALMLGWYVGRKAFVHLLYTKIEQQLYRLRDSGYIVKYDSIKVDWTKNLIEVYRLSVHRDIDTSTCHTNDFLSSSYIKAEGFSVTDLVLRRHLSFTLLSFDSAFLTIRPGFLRTDTVRRKRKDFSIEVDKVMLPHTRVHELEGKTCRVNSKLQGNFAMNGVKLEFAASKTPVFSFTNAESDNIRFRHLTTLYEYRISKISLDQGTGDFRLDTLRITPISGKYQFARDIGYQTDRFEGVIPYINLYGMKLDFVDSLTLNARKLTTQIFLHAFRDKRQPFKDQYRALPMEQLSKLATGISIDSIVLNKSRVVYEEFAEKADSAGHIAVTDLFALIRNVNNKVAGGKTVLTAEASMMGQGKLRLRASFPRNFKNAQVVEGVVMDFPVTAMNSMLEPNLGVKAESGHLHKVDFRFKADNVRAIGEITLNYTDLKLTSLKSKKKQKRHQRGILKHFHNDDMKDGFITFLLNTFVLKRNMDKNMPEEKRTGKISFERNQSKYIFNYWWKSVASGIKSAYNIDRLEDSKLADALRKKKE